MSSAVNWWMKYIDLALRGIFSFPKCLCSSVAETMGVIKLYLQQETKKILTQLLYIVISLKQDFQGFLSQFFYINSLFVAGVAVIISMQIYIVKH